MFTYILILMRFLQPENTYGVTWDYEPVAKAIAAHAESDPLWPKEDDGVLKTAGILVSQAWFESRFNPDAVGDHGDAIGLYGTHWQTAGLDQEHQDLLTDPSFATETFLRLAKQSFSICRGFPEFERLGWYAHGGNGCTNEDGRKKSRHRFYKSEWVLRRNPFVESMQ
jgi:hypothetical protein